MVLVLHISSSELRTPWLPMPLSRKPWKGKWSGPRAGAELICTVPVSMASEMATAALMSRVNTQPCSAVPVGGVSVVQEAMNEYLRAWALLVAPSALLHRVASAPWPPTAGTSMHSMHAHSARLRRGSLNPTHGVLPTCP